MADIKLILDENDGDFVQNGNDLALESGLNSAFIISLFGGNLEDTGLKDNEDQWWGNYLEEDPTKKVHSLTQHYIKTLALSRNNLLRIQDAAKKDLSWALDSGLVTELNVSLSISGNNLLSIVINAIADNKSIEQKYLTIWETSI